MLYEISIALRYLLSRRREKFIPIVTLFSIAGVAVGVLTLIITLSVMGGFEKDLKAKILGMNGHIFIFGGGQAGIQDYSKIIKEIKASEKDIIACAPLIETQAIISSKYENSGIVLRGIVPHLESQVTKLKDYLQGIKEHRIQNTEQRALASSFEIKNSEILLGSEVAKRLGVETGDEILLFITGNKTQEQNLLIPPIHERFTVKGIFTSGMYDYDNTFAYISLQNMQELLGVKSAVITISIKIKDIYQAEAISKRIENKLGYFYWSKTWIDMNKNLFSALRLERTVMFIILCLIVLVAGLNIASTLIMTVLEKTKEIGILKSMGATRISIQSIFIIQGLIIGLIGTVIGCLGGITGCKLLSEYDLIKLPSDVYYISYIPVDMRWTDIGIISLSTIILSLLSALYPANSASKLSPVEALRYE